MSGPAPEQLLWPAGPTRATLSSNDLHVWVAALDTSSTNGPVSDPERQRAARFHRETDRHRFLVQHILLRRLLGSYLDCDPLAVSFRLGPAGKPELELSGAPLHFNISRSAGLGLFAFTCAGPVGVDIEKIAPMPELEMIIQSHFTPSERSALNRLPAHERLLAFFRVWTIKEAVVKATGAGLAGIEDVEVNLSDRNGPRLSHGPKSGVAQRDFHLSSELAPAADVTGHAMVLNRVQEIRCWRVED